MGGIRYSKKNMNSVVKGDKVQVMDMTFYKYGPLGIVT